MERPIVRHFKCPGRAKRLPEGHPHPRMAEDFDSAKVFLDGQEIVVRLLYVCPECGYVVQVDRR